MFVIRVAHLACYLYRDRDCEQEAAVNDQRMKAAQKSPLIIIKTCDLDGAEIQRDVEHF